MISLIIALFYSTQLSAQTKHGAQPNLIFYLADDQDKYDYGCYGNNLIQTPSVDRLAQEGMVFENAFTGQAICAPSRSQLYTGNYPLKNGCFLNHSNTKPDQKSVTTYLENLGYEVILAGKSHVKPASVYNWDLKWPSVKGDGPRKNIPLDSIKSYFKQSDKPFCMFITSMYPHGEYYDVDSRPADSIQFYPFNIRQKENAGFLKSKSGYYRSVLEDDTHLDAVLKWVDEELDDNTLFIYSADHGVSGKFTLYDRGLNVPFVVRWPTVIKAGTRSKALIHYTDVVPTYIEIAGGKAISDIDGKSFLSILKMENSEIHEYVYGVQTNQNILSASVFPSRMIRSKKFKYIRNFNSAEVVDQNLGDNEFVNAFIRIGATKFKEKPYEELYDIVKDPYEQKNLAKDPLYVKIKEKLAIDLISWMKTQGDILTGEPGYMPLIKPKNFALDKSTEYLTVPEDLENTLKNEDYLDLGY